MLESLFSLYSTFLKIGAFAFGGGYAVLPLIQKYVVNDMKWLSMKDLTNLVSLSQVTPGPIGINSATFIGTKVASLPGALVATIAEVTPCCILMLILGRFLFNRQKLDIMDNILKGLKPAISGLILIAAIEMIQSSLFTNTSLNIIGVIGFILGFFAFMNKHISIIKIIIASFILGVIINSIINYI